MSERPVSVTARADGTGDVDVAGTLVFETVAAALSAGAACIEPSRDLCFDLSSVERGDSAGIALLVEWQRVARSRQATVRYTGASEQLRTIALTSNLHRLFEDGEKGPSVRNTGVAGGPQGS